MRVHLSDPAAVADLQEHLMLQGFPASRASEHELDVLFPGSIAIFPAAAELDRWCCDHDGAALTLIPDDALQAAGRAPCS